jgi:hypothetical protein
MTSDSFDDHLFPRLTRRTTLKVLGATAVAALLPPIDFARADVPDALLDPVALDGSPAQAFASHRARANGVAKYFATTRPLREVTGQADENTTVALIAHCHAVAADTNFAPAGAPPSGPDLPAALRRLVKGAGLVGTDGASTKRDYDMALKGLVPLAYRYAGLLGPGAVDFILTNLVPSDLSGGHPPAIEIVEQSFLNIDTPETENHLLMIESSRYLFNQLRFDRTPARPLENRNNGLMTWLLGYMQRIPQHDFLEFNSSPYARLALHALLNLHEFARDAEIRTAAQILLDYSFMKFAISSNRGRRVAPFRRQQHRVAHQANLHNYLYSDHAEQVNGFFLACSGLTGTDDKGMPVRLPPSEAFNALIAGTAAYRPPPAAYELALDRGTAPSLHRFFHGARPRLPSSPDDAEPGFEMYYHSPSFLLSAGGQFLNSGYGHDEVGVGSKTAWEQTSRAQATTLIPTRAEAAFHDLIRFEPYPDPRIDPYAKGMDDPLCFHTTAVNVGVGRGLIAGANLRPADKRTIAENASNAAPALAAHHDGLFIAWRGSGNDNISVARVQATTLLGLDGVEGIQDKVVLGETTDAAPALASSNGRLFLAWRGSGNPQLNVTLSEDDGRTFRLKATFGDATDHAPALAAHDGKLFLAWTGSGNDQLNVAQVILVGNTAGALKLTLENKVVLGDSSSAAPALLSHNGRLFLAWKGSGNNQLNLAFSDDDGRSFKGTRTFGDSSELAPALASHGGQMFYGWVGRGNKQLNVARVTLIGNTAGGFGIEGLEGKVVLGETSTEPPALASALGLLALAWRGEGDNLLNVRISRDGSFQAPGPWVFADLTPFGFWLAAYRTPPARPRDTDTPLESLGFVYVVEKSDMDGRRIDFNRFRDLIRTGNPQLPAKIDYGSTVEFHAADGRTFAIWFSLEGDKYKPRIVERGDAVSDFSTLPLVAGEVMRAPGGHDGLIEIHRPGGAQVPLTLDYRTAAKPQRSDDTATDPAPWIDRALALFALAPKLDQLGRAKETEAALADGALLYDQVLRLDTAHNGPPLAPGVVQGLGTINVDFSVPQKDLRDWLTNPQFTPYPAIAQSLLLLRRKLKMPVYIDVIVPNYEHRATSPRRASDVKPDVLKAAILEGWNVRYGTQVRNFEEILVPLA